MDTMLVNALGGLWTLTENSCGYPPNWREKDPWNVRWEGNFLALVGNQNPTPPIIEFQPQYILPDSPQLHLPDIWEPYPNTYTQCGLARNWLP